MLSVTMALKGYIKSTVKHGRGMRLIATSFFTIVLISIGSHAFSADLESGVNYLSSSQNLSSGTWGGYDADGLRESSVILETLAAFGQTGATYYAGRANISATVPSNTDMLARKIMALVAAQDDVSSLVDELYGAQEEAITDDSLPNFPGRGWGIAAGFTSDTLDTALALRALKSAGESGGVSLVNETIAAGGNSAPYPFDLPTGSTEFYIFVSSTTGSIRVNMQQPTGGTSYVDLTPAQAPIRVGPFPSTPGTWTLYVSNTDTVDVTASVDAGFVRPDGFDTFRLSTALSYLGLAQNTDGGWGISPDEDSNLMITSEVLMALAAWKDSFGPHASLADGVNYLLAMQNADGGFSSTAGTSNVNETAMVVQAISVIDAATPSLALATSYLDAQQSANGSWNDDSFTTALALRSSVAATPLSAPVFTGDGGAGPGQNFTTDLTTIVLEGTAPVGASGINVNVPDAIIDYDSASGTYQITVNLSEGLNNIVISSVDSYGQIGGSTTVEVIRDSSLQGQAVNVQPGYNPIGLSVNPSNSLTAIGLLELLGDGVNEVRALDESTGHYGKVLRDGAGGFTGLDFSLSGLDGVEVSADISSNTRIVGSLVSPAVVNLLAGPNDLTVPQPTADLDAFTLLPIIGSDLQVSGIQRFNPQSGKFEIASYASGTPIGVNFPIEAGVNYTVFMKTAVSGITLPEDITAGIAILSPSSGATVYTSPVTVSGSVSGETPLSVTVNGEVASVVGNTFTVDVPLTTAGSVPLVANLVDNAGRTRSDTLIITYEPVDHVIPLNTTVSGSRAFSTTTDNFSQITQISQSVTGLPAGVNYSLTGAYLVPPTDVQTDYSIEATGTATPGIYNFQVEYGLLDSSTQPLTPLYGNIYDFKILITP